MYGNSIKQRLIVVYLLSYDVLSTKYVAIVYANIYLSVLGGSIDTGIQQYQSREEF